MRPITCWPASRLVSVGAKKTSRYPCGIRLRLTDGADYLRRPAVHPRSTLRCRRCEHDAPQQVGADECDLLGDEAADGEAEQVDASEAHRLEEVDGTVSHGLDGVRRRAGRGGDADVVERNDASIRGERVDERGIPVVEVPAEVLQQNERDVAVAEVAVRVLDPVPGGDSLRRDIGIRRARDQYRLVRVWSWLLPSAPSDVARILNRQSD